MSSADSQDRLTLLEQRLARLEEILGVSSPRPQEAQQEMPPAPPIAEAPEPAAAEPQMPPERSTPPPQIADPVIPPPLPRFAIQMEDRASQHGNDLEQTIGLKWAGWIGAIVLVIGLALGIKYAYDQGWMGAVPPAVRLSFMYLGGFVLLGAGEIVYRRIDRISAAGVFGSGVATLFLVSYAGHGHYALYARETAFVLMGLSTLIGAAVAMRGKLVSIAALSIIGGNVAPMVLEGDPARAVPFLFYLLMLQGVALVLAWWGNSGKWWTLRWLSLITTGLWMTGILAAGDRYYDLRGAPLVFCILFAVLYQTELIASALRARIAPPAAEPDPFASRGKRGVVLSTVVTALLTAALLGIFADATDAVRTACVLGVALVTAALGFGLTQMRFDVLRPLAIAFRIQAAAAVVLAVPVALSGPWVTLMWGLLALAYAALGARLDLTISRAAGVVTWLLALFHLMLWSGQQPEARAVWMTLFDGGIPAYVLLGWLLSGIGHGVAYLVSLHADETTTRSEFDCGIGQLVSWMATGAWGIAAMSGLPPLGQTAALLFYAALLCVGQIFAGRLQLLLQADAALLLATVKWLGVDTLARRFDGSWSALDATPLFNAQVAVGAFLILGLAGLAWLHRRRFADVMDQELQRLVSSITGFLAVLIVLWIGSFEIDRYFEQADNDRAKQVALSVFWSAFAIVSVAAGFRMRIAGLRYFGLGLFALTLVKVFFVDLEHVSQGYRILSFVGLGLLLLGTSVLYGKLSPKLLGEPR